MHGSLRPVDRMVSATALALMAVAVPPSAEPSLAGEVLAEINRERAAAGVELMMRSEALDSAALAKAASLAEEAATFPSSEPAHITSLARLDDLSELLQAVGFAPRRAAGHVVVADRSLTVQDLVAREPALRADLLDPELRELGIARVRAGRVEILVAIVGLSQEVDFATLTRGLEDVDQVRTGMLKLSNDARRERKLRPLRRDSCLEGVAQRYADRMLEEGFYGHLSPERHDVTFRVRRGGCPRRDVGENLARGQTSAEEVIDGWLGSPGHRDNLLRPDFRRVGFGMALGRKGDEYWILWVQVLSGI